MSRSGCSVPDCSGEVKYLHPPLCARHYKHKWRERPESRKCSEKLLPWEVRALRERVVEGNAIALSREFNVSLNTIYWYRKRVKAKLKSKAMLTPNSNQPLSKLMAGRA